MFCEDDADNMLAVGEWAIIRDPFAPSNFLLLFVSDLKCAAFPPSCGFTHLPIPWVFTLLKSIFSGIIMWLISKQNIPKNPAET